MGFPEVCKLSDQCGFSKIQLLGNCMLYVPHIHSTDVVQLHVELQQFMYSQFKVESHRQRQKAEEEKEQPKDMQSLIDLWLDKLTPDDEK